MDGQLSFLLLHNPPLVDWLERKVKIYLVQSHFKIGWECDNKLITYLVAVGTVELGAPGALVVITGAPIIGLTFVNFVLEVVFIGLEGGCVVGGAVGP